jgi:hypothetical protein
MTRSKPDPLFSNLACLTHPLTLAAIATLFLNDHLLKIYYPSPLTGKLSDFAGLFFFPFLLSILLSLALKWTGFTARTITAISFGLTLSGFASIKLFPAVNTFVQAGLSTLTSQPHRFVLDPSDLIALITLVPAWRLWVHMTRKPLALRPSWQWICLLGLATYGSLATSCDFPIETTRLVLHEGTLYSNLPGAIERVKVSAEEGDQTSDWVSATAISEDGGHTWSWLSDDQVPPPVQAEYHKEQDLPLVVCDPQHPLECYRIDGTPIVQASIDGGSSWSTSWRFPFWRYSFANRYANPPFILHLCPRLEIDFSPKDLVLAEDRAGSRTVVAAMGAQGILLGLADGSWEQRQQLDAKPIPLKASTLHQAYDLISPERTLALLVGGLIWLVFNARGWRRILETTDHPPSGLRILWWTLRGFAISAIPFAWIVLQQDSDDPIPALIPAALLVIPILDYALTWRATLLRSPSSKRGLLVVPLALALGGLLYGLTLGIFLLWTFGILPMHTLALLLLGVAAWYLLRWALRILDNLTPSAPSQEPS